MLLNGNKTLFSALMNGAGKGNRGSIDMDLVLFIQKPLCLSGHGIPGEL